MKRGQKGEGLVFYFSYLNGEGLSATKANRGVCVSVCVRVLVWGESVSGWRWQWW